MNTEETPFTLLDKEISYFNTISDQLADMILFKQENLKKFAKFKSYKPQKTLANFDRILWTESLPKFFDKSKTNKQEFTINGEYNDMIEYNLVDYTEVHHDSNTDITSILFKHNNEILDTVEISDKQNLKKALNKALIRTLIDTYNNIKSKSSKDSNVWFNWRTEQAKIQQLENDFPEIKGTFIFESLELNPNFLLLHQEQKAIESIAENVHKTFQQLEPRFVDLMKNTNISLINLAERKKPFYLVEELINELVRDLQLSLKDFDKPPFIDFRYTTTRYTQLFKEPIISENKNNSINIKYEDDVLEVSFKTYSDLCDGRISESRFIEPLEIKSYLTRLYTKWFNAFFTNKEYYFPEDFIKWRTKQVHLVALENEFPEIKGTL